MSTDVRTPQGAAPHPSQDASKTKGRWGRRPVHALLALGLCAGLQVPTAGPAAVATLPSAVMARPSVPSEAILPETVTFSPQLASAPGLFRSIVEEAFPSATVSEPPLRIETMAEPPGNPDEMIPFSGRNVPRWLVHSILKAAHVTGVDPVYMMTLADVESSLSPDAKAPTSSAQGLFQFIDRTWLETVYSHAADYGFAAAAKAIRMVDGEPVVDDKDKAWILSLRCDPYFSALMAGELIKDVEYALRQQGERELAEAELYLAHFLGAGSAVRFLEMLDKDPNTRAAKLFPRAAKANAGLFMDGKGRKRRAVSVAELYNRIDSKIVRRMDRYEDLRPYIAEFTRPQPHIVERTIEANALVP
ncbi:transglycosylase SLT domain-containing protein [Microvirga sp. 17 mud 1-3]|uniref:transglycosylase SLT domain-containing protein n=1 Tax=Microvirga sp. 17 mud 1-3 TaxID=2082949 RepID=UPI000D6B26A7|nr:transglycosylase SLT domain-containing protein [Microvirga sp. 17 mud 1-3]AWM87654.1 lytic transglycosylase [Microvirga sp. 17 mud 1-3]